MFNFVTKAEVLKSVVLAAASAVTYVIASHKATEIIAKRQEEKQKQVESK